MIIFQNPGLIDRRLITTMGVNVKESDDAIGYFGTGLKYAIAVLLREGQGVEIQSGTNQHTFHLKQITIRGKEFQFVYLDTYDGERMETMELGFTTELGKNWQLEQAYRELHCNCVDEGGIVQHLKGDAGIRLTEDSTHVTVTGQKFEDVHNRRHEFILNAPVKEELPFGTIHSGKTQQLFMKGIGVLKMPRFSYHTYNPTERHPLTEDRTLTNGWYGAMRIISRMLMASDDEALIESALLAGEDYAEYVCDYNWHHAVSEQFMRVCQRHRKNPHFSEGAKKWYRSQESSGPELGNEVELTQVQGMMLKKACSFLRSIHYTVWEKDQSIRDFLGDGIMGRAHDGQAYIALMAFEQGTKRLASTILEEHLHITHNFADASREFQDYLLDRLMSLGEELQGAPL
jgi:hypothetical protein